MDLYPNQEENPHIADEFGADAELFIDKVGSKWIQIWDEGYYRSMIIDVKFI